MKDWSISSKQANTPVYLNVYSFCHCCNVIFGGIGLGVYHTAIQIYDIEFMFHGWAGNLTGVSEVLPKSAPYRFEEQILLGTIDYSYWQLDQKIIQPLRRKYISSKYDLLNNNCNHFAYELAQKLGFGHKHPSSYIFRLTNFGNLFRCCIPNCILSGRLDWFRSDEDKEEHLSQIRNSQIKCIDVERRASSRRTPSASSSLSKRRTNSKKKKNIPELQQQLLKYEPHWIGDNR